MSRKTRTTATEQNRVTELIENLNGISGIEFTEDAWKEKAPSNYGVVELTGENGSDYAGGKKIAQSMGVRITIYVTGNSYRWIRAVQGVLSGMNLPYSMPQKAYQEDIEKVMWSWTTRIRMPQICPAEAVGNG